MRPTILWFDEQYNEHFYRSKSVWNFFEEDVDALIVIGTALETAMASNMV